MIVTIIKDSANGGIAQGEFLEKAIVSLSAPVAAGASIIKARPDDVRRPV